MMLVVYSVGDLHTLQLHYQLQILYKYTIWKPVIPRYLLAQWVSSKRIPPEIIIQTWASSVGSRWVSSWQCLY